MKPAPRTHYVAPPRTLFFVGLFLMLFFGVGAWSFLRSLQPMLWSSAPCEVLVFQPTDDQKSDHPFGAKVVFRFQWEGKDYEGRGLGIEGWKDARAQLEQGRRFAVDGNATCYLPDGEPDNAVLYRPSSQGSGLAFVFFSASVGWILLQAHRGRDLPSEVLGAKVMPAVGHLFGGAGVFMLLAFSLPVWIESLQVRSWRETPAKVVWSERRISPAPKNGSTARADICYEYVANGKTWRNNGLFPGGLKTGNLTDTLISSYPKGKAITCRVDPHRPERAVLFASTGWASAFTLFPIPFLVIGCLGLRQFFRNLTKGKR